MSTLLDSPRVIFPDDYDAQSEFETPSRGYLSEVLVQVPDGSRYKVFFTDTTRLSETLHDDVRNGRPYYAEPGMIILPEVTTDSIKRAVAGLWRDGYFKHLKPL